jgi:tRNA A37 threonylcarbamoyladenosine modification protein TsaB
VPLLDARRNEVFAAAYGRGPGCPELLAPLALPSASARSQLEQQLPGPLTWLGSGHTLLGVSPGFRSPEADNPSAYAVGLLAEELDPACCPAVPVYVRDAGATLPRPRS